MRPLPSIVREHTKYRWGIAALFTFVALYAGTNALHWRAPYVLAPGTIEDSLPLLPWTVWIYASYMLISLVAFVMQENEGQLDRFLYTQLAINLVSSSIFFLWPTTFVRPEIGDVVGISPTALQLVWMVDEPVNCLPSLHVSCSIVPALMMWRKGLRVRLLFTGWALAIAFSTMTTKQHHSADVLAGALLAAITYWFFFLRATYARDLT